VLRFSRATISACQSMMRQDDVYTAELRAHVEAMVSGFIVLENDTYRAASTSKGVAFFKGHNQCLSINDEAR